MTRSTFVRVNAGVTALAATTLLLAASAEAQSVYTLVVDNNAVASSQAPNVFTALDINQLTADVGVRDSLPAFTRNEGRTITLPGGTVSHEGWLAVRSVPANWESQSGAADGLENFLYAGPGLGSPDSSGSRISKLGTTASVVPLRAAGLQLLVGRRVCAVAYDKELPRSPSGVTLSGKTLGIVALMVTNVSGGNGTTLPSVTGTVLEARDVCASNLVPMNDAPNP